MIDVIAVVLMCNGIAAFCTAFCMYAVAISRLFDESDPDMGIGESNSYQTNFGRFLAGEIYPDLGKKCSKALLWVVVSFMAVFAFAGIVELTK